MRRIVLLGGLGLVILVAGCSKAPEPANPATDINANPKMQDWYKKNKDAAPPGTTSKDASKSAPSMPSK